MFECDHRALLSIPPASSFDNFSQLGELFRGQLPRFHHGQDQFLRRSAKKLADKIAQRSSCGIKTGSRRLVVVRPVKQLPANTTLAMKNVENGLNRGIRQWSGRRQAIDYVLDSRWTGVPKNMHQFEFRFRETSWFCLVGHAAQTIANRIPACQLYL